MPLYDDNDFDAIGIDDFRGDVCMELRYAGQDDMADEFGGVSDEVAAQLFDMHPDPRAAAALIITGNFRWPVI